LDLIQVHGMLLQLQALVHSLHDGSHAVPAVQQLLGQLLDWLASCATLWGGFPGAAGPSGRLVQRLVATERTGG
jgi:hypothetical protein